MKNLAMVLCFSVLLSIGMIGLASAQDEWQDISAIGLQFSLPADWEEFDMARNGNGHQESIWYKGEFAEPTHLLAMNRGEMVAMLLEVIVVEDDEGIEIISDETIEFLEHDARSVFVLHHREEDYGRFIAIENFTQAGEDFFLVLTFNEPLLDEFQPVLEEIMASFSLVN